LYSAKQEGLHLTIGGGLGGRHLLHLELGGEKKASATGLTTALIIKIGGKKTFWMLQNKEKKAQKTDEAKGTK